MEGGFAQSANRYHFKRARWRRLHRQQIQDWIIAALHNIARLCGAMGSAVIAGFLQLWPFPVAVRAA